MMEGVVLKKLRHLYDGGTVLAAGNLIEQKVREQTAVTRDGDPASSGIFPLEQQIVAIDALNFPATRVQCLCQLARKTGKAF